MSHLPSAPTKIDKRDPAARARAVKGWWQSHRWLVARRSSQLGIFVLFLAGPLAGWWVLKGTLASSLFLGVVPMTDPLIALQAVVAGHALVSTALIGVAVVVGLYLVVGGRAYCGWVCPVNLITDLAHRLRVRLGVAGTLHLPRSARLWALPVILTVSLLTGTIVWETVNPVTMLNRELVFGTFFVGGLGWSVVAAIFLFDLFVANRGWCGHLCPVGAAYGVINRASLFRVTASRREACDNCNACYFVCPEPHVLKPALGGAAGDTALVVSPDCTNCGRCIDVCSERVFTFTHRFDGRAVAGRQAARDRDVGGKAA